MLATNILSAAVVALVLAGGLSSAAMADPTKCVEWKRLGLTQQQNQSIAALDAEWKKKYATTQPQIVEAQKKLEGLLPDPKSDPLEIMATQQTIARLKENLRNEATTNYLRKRAILNSLQQHQLEGMLQQMVMERQRPLNGAAQAEQPGGITNIVNKVRWAIQPH
jgi:hypothetical protein